MRIFACAAVLLVALASASSPNPEGCNPDAKRNVYPIWGMQAGEEPALLKQVTNGKLYVAGGAEVQPNIDVMHLFGSPYEVGVAQGQMVGDKMKTFIPDTFAYFESFIEMYGIKLHIEWLAKVIAEKGVPFALDLTWDFVEKYVPDYFVAELEGLADGSGLDVQQIKRTAMIPQLIRMACSMVGAWGDAVKNIEGATLMQLRALDWQTGGPFGQYPAIQVYHPDQSSCTNAAGKSPVCWPSKAHTFYSFSWDGFVGALTGFSNAEVGICEKVWDQFKGDIKIAGIPATFMLRDLLLSADTKEDAHEMMQSANRTCAIWVGVGDSKSNQFDTFNYAGVELNLINATFPGHEYLPDMRYVNKHVQPSHNPCFQNLLKDNYGNIAPEVFIRDVLPIEQTGSTHVGIFDYAAGFSYFAHTAPPANVTSPIPDPNAQLGYDRPFIRLDHRKLFAETL
jgi:hypothetical protein